jgi:hypothetical protein
VTARALEQLPPQLADLGFTPEITARGVADETLGAIRAELEAARLVEYRTVTLAGLIERFGTSYLERGTLELSAAVEALAAAGAGRAGAVGRLATTLGLRSDATLAELIDASPAPFAAALAQLRRDLNAAKRRIGAHADRTTDLLGRRLALLAETISGHPDGLAPTYGRPAPTTPRLVRGVL